MKAILAASLVFALASVGINRLANADEHDNHHYVRHDEWRRARRFMTKIGGGVSISITTRPICALRRTGTSGGWWMATTFSQQLPPG